MDMKQYRADHPAYATRNAKMNQARKRAEQTLKDKYRAEYEAILFAIKQEMGLV